MAATRRRAALKPRWLKFEAKFAALGKGRIASIIGRYYAMDRDNRWDRVEQAYDLLTLAKGEFQADTAVAGLQAAYARDENDEFVKATVIRAAGQADAAMEDGDALIFMNFRADRAREITRAFVNADFDGFARKKVVNLDFVMLTEYAADIKVALRLSTSLTGEHLRRVDGEARQNPAAHLRNREIRARDLLLQRRRRRAVQRRRPHPD